MFENADEEFFEETFSLIPTQIEESLPIYFATRKFFFRWSSPMI